MNTVSGVGYLLYGLGKSLFALLFTLLFNIRVEGRESFPVSGPVVFCANHISWWDPPLLAVVAPRTVRFMAKQELFSNRVFGYLLRGVGAFPIKRGAADRRAIKEALSILETGQALGMFPEGTRSTSGEMGQGLQGASFMALKTKAVILPAAISGEYRFRGEVVVRIGEPFYLDTEGTRSQQATRGATAITEAIGRLKD